MHADSQVHKEEKRPGGLLRSAADLVRHCQAALGKPKGLSDVAQPGVVAKAKVSRPMTLSFTCCCDVLPAWL
jgi:hypothetical protein